MISSFINLQNFSEAKIEFKNLQNNIEDRQDKAELEKKLKVLEENINGEFDWSEMVNQYRSSGKEAMKLELFDFLNRKVKIQQSEPKGLGLFARRKLRKL